MEEEGGVVRHRHDGGGDDGAGAPCGGVRRSGEAGLLGVHDVVLLLRVGHRGDEAGRVGVDRLGDRDDVVGPVAEDRLEDRGGGEGVAGDVGVVGPRMTSVRIPLQNHGVGI